MQPAYTSRTARGTASELIGAAHLMSQGFYVFFATSTSVPFDLVAYQDGKFNKVEVRSLSLANNCPCFGWPGPKQEWDILIAVSEEGRCFQFYAEPSLTYSDCIDSIRADLGLPPVHRPSSILSRRLSV